MKHPFETVKKINETMKTKTKKFKDWSCQHMTKHNRGFYIYEMVGRDLVLCKSCEERLRKKIFEQSIMEKECHNMCRKAHIVDEDYTGIEYEDIKRKLKQDIKNNLQKIKSL